MIEQTLVRLVRSVCVLGELSGVRFAIIGGVARGVWTRPRGTQDVDVIIDRPVPDVVFEFATRDCACPTS